MSAPRLASDHERAADGTVTHGAIVRSHEQWRDEQPTTQRCADCPDWLFEGTAADGREASRAHVAEAHPERVGRRTRRKPTRLNLGQKAGDGIVEDAKRERAERDEAQMLEKIERGRERDARAARDGYTPRAGTRPARILELLSDGRARRFSEVRDAVGGAAGDPKLDARIHAALTVLVSHGLAVKVERGVYAIGGPVEDRGGRLAPAADLLKRPQAAPDMSERESGDREAPGAASPVEAEAVTAAATVSGGSAGPVWAEPGSRSEIPGLLRMLVRDALRVTEAIEALCDALEREAA